MSKDISATLAYTFKDETLITKALTHKSANSTKDNNAERLEFLGDRVLGLCIAEMLMQSYPNDNEGGLSKRLHHLVNRETLAEIATEINLASHLIVDEDDDELRYSDKILADSIEAIIAAIHTDGGLQEAEKFINKHWKNRCDALSTPPTDAKTNLQEWSLKHYKTLPQYQLTEQTGPSHAPQFTVTAKVANNKKVSAIGKTIKAAEANAAQKLYLQIMQNNDS